MNTFTQDLDLIAADAYQTVILPGFRKKAPKILSDGLGELRGQAKFRATAVVVGSVGIEKVEEAHRDVLVGLVREIAPVDVLVYLDSEGTKISFAPGLYRAGDLNGKLEYDFPTWQKRGGGLVHNMAHLKEREMSGDDVTVFKAVLKQFGSVDGEELESDLMPGEFDRILGREILDRVLTWAMVNISAAVSMSHEDLRKLYACMAAGAVNVSQLKPVSEAYQECFSTK